MDLEEVFEKYADDYLNGEYQYKDLAAFLMLEQRGCLDRGDVISGARHEEIFLNVDMDELAKQDEAFIQELVRCGVRFTEYDCLGMFV